MCDFVKDAYQFRTFDVATNTYRTVKRAATAEEKAVMRNLRIPVLDILDVYDPSRLKSFDWQNAFIRQGVTNSHSINMTAGSEKLRGGFGASYFKQKGIELGQDYTRYTVNSNLEFKPVKALTFGNTLSYTNSTQNVGPSIYGAASAMLPITRPYDTS